MALQVADGFHTGVNLANSISYSGTTPTLGTGPAAGTKYIAFPSAPGATIPLPTAAAVGIIQAWVNPPSNSWGSTTAGSQLLEALGDAGATAHVCITVSADGHWQLKRGGPNGTLLATSTAVTTADQWHYLKLSVVLHDTTGNVVLNVDGVEVINFTGDTKNAGTLSTVSSFRLGSFNGAKWSSVLVMDATGATFNAFVGERVIRVGRPDGAGASTGLTPSAGSNWQCVDEDPWTTADYVSAAATATDTYTHSDVSGFSSVDAVQVIAYALKTDAGARTLRTVERSNLGTSRESSDLALTTSAAVVQGPIRETDPDAAAWTQALVNTAQFGVKVV